jgi:radical SAM superfamily enzyme YgiQ (UPF0313 family)
MKIKSIKKLRGEIKLYNISCNPHNNYFANGVLVHNCNVQHFDAQYKNADYVVDEMEYLKGLGCGSVHVLDDNFNAKESHLRDILSELRRRLWDTEWSARGQVRTKLKYYEGLADTGLKRMHVGIESLDDDTLKWFRKTHRYEGIEKFCDAMHANNIDILGYFICGAPTETEYYRESLPERIEELGIKYPFFNVLYPEPDTEYYEWLLKEPNKWDRDYWGEFMKDPIRDYCIPFPYGEEERDKLMSYNDFLVSCFKDR